MDISERGYLTRKFRSRCSCSTSQFSVSAGCLQDNVFTFFGSTPKAGSLLGTHFLLPESSGFPFPSFGERGLGASSKTRRISKADEVLLLIPHRGLILGPWSDVTPMVMISLMEVQGSPKDFFFDFIFLYYYCYFPWLSPEIRMSPCKYWRKCLSQLGILQSAVGCLWISKIC